MPLAFLPKLAVALLAGGVAGMGIEIPSPTAAVLFAVFITLAGAAYLLNRTGQALWMFTLVAAILFGLFLARQASELEQGRFARLFGPVDNLAVRVLSDPYLERQVIVELIDPPHTSSRMSLSIASFESPPAFRQTIRLSGIAHGTRIIPTRWEPFEGSVPALNPIEQAHFFCLKIRDRVDRALEDAKPPAAFLAFARAELFGKRSGLDPRDLRILQDHGLTHIIAVSGMHTTLLASVLFFLLAPALGRESAAFVTLAAVAGFCVIVGMQPAVLRASIATSLTILGTLLNRPVRLINITAASFIVEFILFPEHLSNAGFQLSYLAILGISIAAAAFQLDPGSTGQGPLQERWLKSLLSLLFIQIFTAPISAHVFYRWSALSIVSNLLFLPIFTFLIALAALAACCALLWPALAAGLGWIGDACLRTTLNALGDLQAFLSVSSNYGRCPLWFLAAFLTAWILFLTLVPRSLKNWLIGAAAFLTAFALFPAARNALDPQTILIGGTRSSYIAFKNGGAIEYARIDLPPNSPAHIVRPVIRELLQDGIQRIDVLRAHASVLEMLRQEFEIGTISQTRMMPGLKELRGGGMIYRHDGLELVYAKPEMILKHPFSSPELAGWLVLEPNSRGEVALPQSHTPGRAYILGSLPPERLKLLMDQLEAKGISEVLAASVDGQVKLYLDRRQGWQYTTTLMESLIEE